MAPFATNRFHGPCQAVYIGDEPATLRDLHPLLVSHFPLCSAVQLTSDSSPRELAEALQSSVQKFCILDVRSGSEPELIQELLRLDPGLGIVTVLPGDNPDLILPCLRLGALYFLIPPFTADQIVAAAQKLIKAMPVTDPLAAPGKIYCVLPAKGACGATTIACNLAFQWKRMAATRVLLADLDPFTGTLGFLLKVKSAFSFADVLSRAADMDADLWKAMVTDCQGVDVLLSPDLPLEGSSELADASSILDYARFNYTAVVLDAGSAMGDWSLSQARLSDELLLVATNELPALYAAQRVIQYLEGNGIGRWKIKIVLNRYDERVGVSSEVVSNALGMEVFGVLPSDDASVQKSLMEGKPIATVSTLGKRLAALAERLAGREEPTRKPSSLAGLFSRLARRPS